MLFRSHFDGAMLRGPRPVLECFTLLGALAAATTTIGIGSMVVNVANRHPAVAAAAAASVQRMSGGRFRMGIGAGSAPGSRWAKEHDDMGIPLLPLVADRHAAVAEQIRRLREEEPMQVIVGVNSSALAQIAGRIADGVNVRLSHPRAAQFLDAARDAAGDRPFECSGWAFLHDWEARERADELGIDRLVLTHAGPSA